MIFKGIAREFSLTDDGQYDTIGEFWDEMTDIYGLENLVGLGYKWEKGKIYYAIGLKRGEIDGYNLSLELPDTGWSTAPGRTAELKEIYGEIYRQGRLTYEIESFNEDGICQIRYYR